MEALVQDLSKESIKQMVLDIVNKEKIPFDKKDSEFMHECLLDYMTSLKLNNGTKKRIQRLQQILDRFPNGK